MQDLSTINDYQASDTLLAGKNIIVTGAGDGIGKAAALSFAAHGATVILVGKTIAKLALVYDEIEAAGHPQPVLVELDLAEGSYEDFSALNNEIIDQLGSLHGLLHNAGILGEMKPLGQYDAETFDQVIKVNLSSNFKLTQALMPALNLADHASVIFTSSGVGRKSRAYWGAYAVSKFGIEGLMQTWADELADTSSIRVNSLNPGATQTQMRKQAYPGEALNSNPEPSAIMNAYLYLMGPDSIGVNGHALNAQKK
ncbi:MAG: YciK family oxidoreductase [Cellvibrionales bacterium]|mgnify:FL=1|nr:YciK family oxidoreductase [Cellvibrionales bacterium]HCH20383.1 YciK family oxidoreductase [Cellvibrionales bacterium]|tara:strand:- start:15 stop:779 length:765 start_codon:yes stop_codon:yes gene_type:complete